jgi:hypothetical protein
LGGDGHDQMPHGENFEAEDSLRSSTLIQTLALKSTTSRRRS